MELSSLSIVISDALDFSCCFHHPKVILEKVLLRSQHRNNRNHFFNHPWGLSLLKTFGVKTFSLLTNIFLLSLKKRKKLLIVFCNTDVLQLVTKNINCVWCNFLIDVWYGNFLCEVNKHCCFWNITKCYPICYFFITFFNRLLSSSLCFKFLKKIFNYILLSILFSLVSAVQLGS